MGRFSRAEVEEQFAHLYYTGCVAEDWTGWADLFTDDCTYTEHFWGVLHGNDEVRAWIDPVMLGVPEIYTVLDWYVIDDDKVVWALQNRRDNPDPDGPDYFDFPGLSVAWYAGDGRWVRRRPWAQAAIKLRSLSEKSFLAGFWQPAIAVQEGVVVGVACKEVVEDPDAEANDAYIAG